MRYVRATVVMALSALLPGAAFAQSAWDAMQSFGMTGTWASSCKTAASPSNYWMTYYQDAGGVVRRKVDLGPGRPPMMGAVDSAQIVTATTIDTHIRNDDPAYGATNGLVFDVVLVKENGRMRTLVSTGSDGHEYIKGGVITSSGTPAPWIEKCSN